MAWGSRSCLLLKSLNVLYVFRKQLKLDVYFYFNSNGYYFYKISYLIEILNKIVA